MSNEQDPFVQFKAMQREAWDGFGANEGFTTLPAAALVNFASVAPGERVLDVGCGTGVVAVTAARRGAQAFGLDLTPRLLERAKENARVARVEVDFREGDAEKLPFEDGSFDVVLSQLGHIFAPRPDVATAELLRVLKPRGRVAFTVWPPEHETGRLFMLLGKYMPQPPAGAPVPAPPVAWGIPDTIRTRLGESVADLRFKRGFMIAPALSPEHVAAQLEATFGPLQKLVAGLAAHPEKLATLRSEMLSLIKDGFVADANEMRQHFLMACAVKR